MTRSLSHDAKIVAEVRTWPNLYQRKPKCQAGSMEHSVFVAIRDVTPPWLSWQNSIGIAMDILRCPKNQRNRIIQNAANNSQGEQKGISAH